MSSEIVKALVAKIAADAQWLNVQLSQNRLWEGDLANECARLLNSVKTLHELAKDKR